jgi:hypothetical protein
MRASRNNNFSRLALFEILKSVILLQLLGSYEISFLICLHCISHHILLNIAVSDLVFSKLKLVVL